MNTATDLKTARITNVRIIKTPAEHHKPGTRYAGQVRVTADRAQAELILYSDPRTSDLERLIRLVNSDLSQFEPEDGYYYLLASYSERHRNGPHIRTCSNSLCVELYHEWHDGDDSTYFHVGYRAAEEGWSVSVEAMSDRPWGVCAEAEDDITPEKAIEFAAAIIEAADRASSLNAAQAATEPA